MLVVGACLAVKLALGKTEGGHTGVYMRLRKGAARAAAGVVLLGLAVAGLVLAYAKGTVVYRHPQEMTRIHLSRLQNEMENRLKAAKPIPDDPRQLVGEGQDHVVEDGWFHRIRIEKATSEAKTTYVAASAGPDGEFGTADDIRSEAVPSPPSDAPDQPPGESQAPDAS